MLLLPVAFINQSIETHLYSAICRKRIRGMSMDSRWYVHVYRLL